MTSRDCLNADGSPKRRYRSAAAAEKLARRQNHDRPFEAPVHAYLCPDGGRAAHWHIGHPREAPP
jgi:hypothetical protein